jgi:hypothetical protein
MSTLKLNDSQINAFDRILRTSIIVRLSVWRPDRKAKLERVRCDVIGLSSAGYIHRPFRFRVGNSVDLDRSFAGLVCSYHWLPEDGGILQCVKSSTDDWAIHVKKLAGSDQALPEPEWLGSEPFVGVLKVGSEVFKLVPMSRTTIPYLALVLGAMLGEVNMFTSTERSGACEAAALEHAARCLGALFADMQHATALQI